MHIGAVKSLSPIPKHFGAFCPKPKAAESKLCIGYLNWDC